MRELQKKFAKRFFKEDPKVLNRVVEDKNFKGICFESKDSEPIATILYLHGGGYGVGSSESSRQFLTYLSKVSNTRVFALDYRLAPEDPFPAALEDAYNAYKWLLGEDTNIKFVGGDSAGGGLTLALLQVIKREGDPMPAGGILLNPWVDLTNEAVLPLEIFKKDKILGGNILERWKEGYVGSQDPQNPLISPLYADLKDFPPLFIQTGTADCLTIQAIELENRAKNQGVKTVLDVWEGMPHVWQTLFAPHVSESNKAIQNICKFIEDTLSQ